MSVKVGDVAVMKTSGDKVFVLKEFPETGMVNVRIPLVSSEGSNEYTVIGVLPEELCTVEEYFNAIAEEMFMKSVIQKKLLDRAKELDTEEAITAAEPASTNNIVPFKN
jgi:hypothetical protein